MFIWLTNPITGQVLVNPNLITTATCVQGRNAVYFTGSEENYITLRDNEKIHVFVRRKR